MTVVTADRLASNESTVLLFDGHDENNHPVRFACEAWDGYALLGTIAQHGPTLIELRDWQLLA